MKKVFYLCFAFLVTLTGCLKEDKRLPGKTVYDRVGRADMVSENGKDYQKQVYYDLHGNEVRASHYRDSWDIALSCDPANPNLFTNPALSMSVAATGVFALSAPFNPKDYSYVYERADRFFTRGIMKQDFDAEGLAQGEVFILNMGNGMDNRPRGYRLIQIVSYLDGTYTLRTANTDLSNLQEIQVVTDATYNNVYLSFAKPGQILHIEPPKTEWDLVFTKYMERLYDNVSDTLDYSVTGVLLNPYLTEAAFHEESYKDSTLNYSALTLDDLNESDLTGRQNVIGHEWKDYDLDNSVYVVDTRRNYFVRDREGRHFKMHFTGFYSAGNKGAVSFQYLPL